MKLVVEMTEDEVREACEAWAHRRLGNAAREVEAELIVSERRAGPREALAGHNVTARVRLTLSEPADDDDR